MMNFLQVLLTIKLQFLILLNTRFLFQVGGSGLIAVGFWMRLSGDVLGTNILGVFSIYAVNTVKVDIYFISVGIIMALLGFLGCCGAKKESKCLLIMFFSIIVVIFIAELTIGLFALAYSAYVSFTLRSQPPHAPSDLSCSCLFLFACTFLKIIVFLTIIKYEELAVAPVHSAS
ncbi:tetraspanin-1 [Ictalurus furcatus]|uniref:tetraspanin-1 n=1 Tax=Ictalurus furcatus TaxID=66913 RepID=UPI0023504E06|nr:tetraspanin-1 [Ictalurus furcatus]